jgi:hypothetical protein
MENRIINKYINNKQNVFDILTYSTYIVRIYDGGMLYNNVLYLQEINSEIILIINKNDELFPNIIKNLYLVYKDDRFTLYTGTKSMSVGKY